MLTKTYAVDGMDCADCALKIEKGVSQLDGAKNVRVDFITGKLQIEGDVSDKKVRERIVALGYAVQQKENVPARVGGVTFLNYLLARHETRLALIGGGGTLIAILLNLIGAPSLITDILLIAAMCVAGYPIAKSGLSTLIINRDFNINLLMSIAAVGAVIIGETSEAATMIFLFAIAEAIEGYTTDRARDSLRSLTELSPAEAIRIDGDAEERVATSDLKLGDVILVRGGDRIAMDGVIVAGASEIDQAPITGESMPVHKTTGEKVFAGTMNGSGTLQIRVTHLAQDNTLSRIIKLVEETQSARAPSQRAIDEFARYYTPSMVVLAILVASLPPIFFAQPFFDTASEHGWLYRALAMLVIACPCALVISAPVTVISAMTNAARRGVLIKGGAHLESLGRVKVFAFDKTGTLTRGEAVVTAHRSIDCETGGACAACDDVLALAAALEKRSAHPLAQSVIVAAESRGVGGTYNPAIDVQTFGGRGLKGYVNGKLATLGHHQWFDDEHPHSDVLCSWIDEAEARGETTMLLCDGDRVRGYIAVSDAVRDDSKEVIAQLRSLGNATIMLTGDNATVAKNIGDKVGVDAIRSDLLPQDKSDAVKMLKTQHGAVAMVGDGINDTPALAAATVGISFGGAASAQAIETADVVLMGNDLRQLPFAVRLSRFARSLIMSNITISIGTKLLFAVLALFGFASLWMAVLADMGVSLLVTLNGMRAVKFENKSER
ncbi:MAG: heavy metal translocating P-type ATPase [Chloroflexi bacterium]|nr:heavy metal translocating P-type ATPase [Chloroflexota bacterium]